MGGFGNGGPPSSSSSPSFPERRGPPPPPPGRQPGDWTPFDGDEPPSSGGRPPPPPNGFPGGGFRATDLPVEDHLVEDPQKVTSRAISLRIRKIDVPSFMSSSLSHNLGPIKRTPGNPTGSQERTQRKFRSSLSSASFSSRMTSSHIQLTNERSTPPSPISKDWHSIGLLCSSLPLPFRPC